MKKWMKWVKRILLGILILLVIVILSIHTAPVKKLVRNRLQAFLSSKIKTEIHIGTVDYVLPKWVEIDSIFLRDKVGDTLLYAGKIRVDINMLQLLSGKYEISKIDLQSAVANVSRNDKDSLFNYQFIIDAFASKQTNTSTNKSPVSLSLNEINIAKTSINFKDKYGGTLMTNSIGSINIKMKGIDINAMKFDISKCTIADVFFDLQLLKNLNKKESTNATADKAITPSVTLSELEITKSRFSFNGEETSISTSNDIGEIKLFNLLIKSPQDIILDKFELSHSTLSLDKYLVENISLPKNAKDSLANDLKLVIKNISLTENSITYNNIAQKKLTKGFDANHIKIDSLNADITDVLYTPKNTKVNIKSMSLNEQSGFDLNKFQVNFAMTDSVITATNFIAKTPASSINGTIKVYPASFAENYNGKLQNDIILNNNVVALRDIELLAPAVLNKYKKQLQGVSYLYANADITGNAKHLNIKNVIVHSNKNDIYINTAGTIENATSKNNISYNLSIAKLIAAKSFLDPFVNADGKQTINLPAALTVSGKLNGNIIELNNDIVVSSEYGVAVLKGQIKNFTKPDNLKYNMRLIAKNLEIGKWIKQDSLLGKMTGNIALQGSGIDYKTASVVSDINLTSFRINQHIYQGIYFKANGKFGMYDVKGNIKDSMLMLNMDMHTSLKQKYPTATGKLNIDNADLFALGFYKTPLSLQTKADIQLNDLTPENLNAFLRLDSTIVLVDKKAIRADSVLLKAIRDSGKTLISIAAPMIDGKLNGDYKYDELAGVLQKYFAKYAQSKPANNSISTSKINFDFNVDIKPNPMFALLLPGLLFDKKIQATAHFDNKLKDSVFAFNLNAPNFAYQTNHLANLQMKVNGINDSIKYAINLDTIRTSSLLLYTTSFAGGFSNNHLSADIVTNDENKKAKYGLALTGTIEENLYKVHLEDKLKLNYADWIVDKQNLISYSNDGINVSNFKIIKQKESVSINSSSAAMNAPINIDIAKFSLQNITALLNKDSLEIGGLLNVQAKIDGLDKAVPLFSGNIKVDSLSYQTELVGDIKLDAQNNNQEAITFNGSLTGKGNNVELKGIYDQSKIDAQINLNPISFAAIQPFAQHNLKNSSGNIKGIINVTGNVKSPEWNGNISFDNAHTQLAKYGTVLKINGQEIKLNYPTVTFNQFTVKDTLNNPITIDGTVESANGNFNTNLTVTAKGFTLLDNTMADNEQLYGKAIADLDVTISGTASAPDVNGDVSLKDESQVTFVRTQNIASAKDREGLVEFVDIDTIRNKKN